MQQLESAPVAQVDILVRRPRREVSSAFVDPEKITQFWLSKASGPLAPGRRVQWDFMVRGASNDVEVKAVEEKNASSSPSMTAAPSNGNSPSFPAIPRARWSRTRGSPAAATKWSPRR